MVARHTVGLGEGEVGRVQDGPLVLPLDEDDGAEHDVSDAAAEAENDGQEDLGHRKGVHNQELLIYLRDI